MSSKIIPPKNVHNPFCFYLKSFLSFLRSFRFLSEILISNDSFALIKLLLDLSTYATEVLLEKL